MIPAGAFWELVKLELWRGRVPLARSLIAPGLLLIVTYLRGHAEAGTVLGLCGVALALSVVMVGLQVGRDRENGILRYFAEMPLRGELLVGVRFGAVTIFSLIVTGILAAGSILWPAAGLPPVGGVLLSLAALSQVLGWVVVALLSRFSWTTVVTGPVVILIGLGFIADLLRLGEKFSQWVPSGSAAEAGAVLTVLGVLLWVVVGLVALAAFVLGAKWLQPHGQAPTEEARALLQNYHGDGMRP